MYANARRSTSRTSNGSEWTALTDKNWSGDDPRQKAAKGRNAMAISPATVLKRMWVNQSSANRPSTTKIAAAIVSQSRYSANS
jgi:hypothetical protein